MIAPTYIPIEKELPPRWDDHFQTWFTPVIQYDGETIYELLPKQKACLDLTPLNPLNRWKKYYPEWIGFGGAAGGGKSYLARAIAAIVNHVWPGSTVIIFRQTKDVVYDNHVAQGIFEEVPQELYHWNGSTLTMTWKANRSRTRFTYLRRYEDIFRFQGPEYTCFIFEEATHYEWKSVNWLMSNRLRTTIPHAKPFGLFPSNPGNVGHFWYKRLFIDRNLELEERGEIAEQYAFIQAKLEDNPILLRNDPNYVLRLNRLPEPDRGWMRDGDFEAGGGLALAELNADRHRVQPFPVPQHWTMFGAFDWGFEHPWCFGVYAVSEDGWIYKCDTITSRRDNAHQIDEKVRAGMRLRGLDFNRLTYISAGHDTFEERRGRSGGEYVPKISERLQDRDWPLVRANTGRAHGLTNLREYLAWWNEGPMMPREEWEDPRFPEFEEGDPALFFMDTPGNRITWECLATRVPDPLDLTVVLKTDADDWGEGGDDSYDETRFAVASRPARARSVGLEREIRAFDPEVLKREAREGRRSKPNIRRQRPKALPPGTLDPQFGDQI